MFYILPDAIGTSPIRNQIWEVYNMAKGRIVFKNENGMWANEKMGAEKASSLHETQKQAENAARKMLKSEGGGELITKGLNGKIRSKDTIPPAKDPNPPRDREH